MSEPTEADELAALRGLVGLLLIGIQGTPQTVQRGKQVRRFYRAEHDVTTVERARKHFEGRKHLGLLKRLETLETALDGLTDTVHCRYDHNDWCQSHYSARPCCMEVARAVLRGTDEH